MTQPLVLTQPTSPDSHPGDIGRVEPTFARHESFHPRYGWLKKGFDAALDDPGVFLRSDAPVTLGVGKNMVRAIRYWSRAFKVLEEYPDPDRPRQRFARPTDFGRTLLHDGGWDPFLEDPGSLWLLHWKLLQPPSLAPSWYYAFNLMRSGEFTDIEAMEDLKAFRDAHTGWARIVDRSLKRDLDCLLRMYTLSPDKTGFNEDSIDSPFLDLRLISATAGDRRHFTFNIGPKDSLPDALVAYACADFLDTTASHNARTIAVRRLAYDEGSPGRAFKLSESALRDSLERFAATSDSVLLTDPAGVHQLNLLKSPEVVRLEALEALYGPASDSE